MITAPTNPSHEAGGIALDLTAMLDVIFILLVFFILTANAAEHALEMDLPRDGADQAQTLNVPKRLDLKLLANDRWALGDRIVSDWPEVVAAMEQANLLEQHLVIAGDRQIPMERLLQVLAEVKRIGLSNAQVLMNPHSPTPSKP